MNEYSASAAAIETATSGRVARTDLNNWVRFDLFNTRLSKLENGKPRLFPQFAVYEAALLSIFVALGVPLKIAKEFNKNILDRLRQSGRVARDYSAIGLVFFNPYDLRDIRVSDARSKLNFIGAAYDSSMRRAFDQTIGMPEKDGTYSVKSCSLSAIHLGILFDHLDRALDRARFHADKSDIGKSSRIVRKKLKV